MKKYLWVKRTCKKQARINQNEESKRFKNSKLLTMTAKQLIKLLSKVAHYTSFLKILSLKHCNMFLCQIFNIPLLLNLNFKTFQE